MKILSCSTPLACGYFKFRSKLSELFIDALPPYLILRQDDQALTECLHIFKLIRWETRSNYTACENLIKRLTSIFLPKASYFNYLNNQDIKLWKLFNDPILYILILEIIIKPKED